MSKKHDKPIEHKTTGKGKTYNPTEKGAGMTAKGRAEYNAKNKSNLKPPAPNPKTKADEGRKASFCARMEGVVKKAKGPAERAKASKELELLMATKPGLYANIHAKQERIKAEKAAGKPVEKMRKVGSKGAPTKDAFKQAAKTAKGK